MVAKPGDYGSATIENYVGRGKFQYLSLLALCAAYGMVPIHTYSSMFVSTEPTWHRNCTSVDALGGVASISVVSCAETALTAPANCSVPLEQWEVDAPGRSIVGDFKLECGRREMIPDLGSLYFLGWAIGVVICGSVSDVIGRRWAYFMGYVLLGVGGLLGPLAPNYTVYAAARVLVGIGVAEVGLASYVWATEFLDISLRGVMSWLPNVATSVGQLMATPLALALPQWRTYLLGCQVVSFVGMVYWWSLRESPQWLASVGRGAEAHDVLCAMARANGRPTLPPPPPPDGSDEASEAEVGSVSTTSTTAARASSNGSLLDLLDRRLRFRICVMSFNWFSVSLGFYGVALFAPNLPFSIYTANALTALVPVPFYMVAPVLVDSRWCGRKGATAGSFIVGGALLMLCTQCKHTWLSMTLYFAANATLCLAFAVLYVWAAELFPTDIRTRCMGVQSVFARIGAMLSPFLVDFGRDNPALALCSLALPCVVAGVLDMFLPETRGLPFPATVADLDRCGHTGIQADMLREPFLEAGMPSRSDGGGVNKLAVVE